MNTVIFTALFLFTVANSAIVDINWGLGVEEEVDVASGDTVNFRWTQNINHNVEWTPQLFPTSTVTDNQTNVETYVIPGSASENTYIVKCTIHPSIVVTLRVDGGAPTISPTGSPTSSPTGSPSGSPDTSPPTVSPTDAPSVTPTSSPTVAPTPFPTILLVTVREESGGLTTVVIVGIIIASVAAIAAALVGFWSYKKVRGSQPVKSSFEMRGGF